MDALLRDNSSGGSRVAKDKKKEKVKKANAAPKPVKTAVKKIKQWTENPMVADIVAAALVASAAALKDPRKAQRLAAEAGEEIEKLSKKGAERGNALWQMALEIGRRSLEEIAASTKTSRRK
jgi:hypothetical protein